MHGPSHSSAQSVPRADASNLHWAIYYASRGWLVLPLYSVEGGRCTCGDVNCRSPGNHPRTQYGVKDASVHSWQINLWWRWWPSSNVGIATGVASGLLVLGVDPANGGDASYEQLRKQFPAAFAQLLEVQTSVGGIHLYFECRSPTPSRANILPGIDVLADGNYIVAPPSLDVSGVRCRFTSNGGLLLPPLPQPLCDLIIAEPQAQAGDEASPRRAIIKAEHVADSIDETPQQNGEGSLSGETKQAREKPDQDGSATNDVKPRLLVDNSNPDHTVRALQGILGATGEIFDRGVPVRLVSDPHRGTVARMITADALVMMAHKVCRPYMLKAKRNGADYEENVRLPKLFAAMYLDYGGWGLPPLNGITTAPLLHDNGTIRSARGYDVASGMWCESVPDLTGRIPDRPTREDATAAFRLIRGTFKTFCFADAEMRMDDAAGSLPEVDLSKPPGRDEVLVSGRLVDGGLSGEPAPRTRRPAARTGFVGRRHGQGPACPLHVYHRIRARAPCRDTRRHNGGIGKADCC